MVEAKDSESIAHLIFKKYGNDSVEFNRLLRKRIGTRGSRFSHDHPDTFMYIERSKNSNIVAYTANMLLAETKTSISSGVGNRCVVNPNDPVHAYFITIDPPTLEDRKKRGKMEEIDELNYVQRKFAYGCNAKVLKQPLGKEVKEDFVSWYKYFTPFAISYVALPKSPALLLVIPPLTDETKKNEEEEEEEYKGENDTVVALVTVVNGVLTVLQRVYVSSTEPKHFYQLPTVNYIEMFGVSLETGEETYEKRSK